MASRPYCRMFLCGLFLLRFVLILLIDMALAVLDLHRGSQTHKLRLVSPRTRHDDETRVRSKTHTSLLFVCKRARINFDENLLASEAEV